MSFASDKLYDGYLRRNMGMIVSRVRAREIMVHLPCLTLHDRETIEAKRETSGNFNSMVLLLDCLRRRENWPEQFIEALEACEQTIMAAEIRAEYDALRGVNNSSPSSPSTTAVRADVHPPPAASHPDNGGNTGAAVAPPAEASAAPQPAAQASAPLTIPVHPQAPSSAAHVPEAVPAPEPVSQPPQSPQVEVGRPTSTPPASPQTPHSSAGTPPPPPSPPPPQSELLTHQEPEENSESDIQESPESVETPPPSHPVEQGGTDAPAPATAATELRPPQSPSPTQANSDVTDGSSFLTLTPERPPVQDTAPPLGKTPAVVQEPEETSEPSTTQVINSSPQRDTAAATVSTLPAAARMDACVNDDLSVCMSKPGQLISIQPQNHDNPPVPAHNRPAEPYSGDSQRLEISEAPSDAVTSASIPVCQENGIAPTHNEPEENHYESLCESSEVRVNVGHVSEEPSILNLDAQISAPQAQIINGEAAREISPPAASSNTAADTVSSESCRPSDPASAGVTPERKTLPDPEEKKPASHILSSKYIMTAAGVGAFALLMAWKLKN